MSRCASRAPRRACRLNDGTIQFMSSYGTEYGTGRPIFATNYCFPVSGGIYTRTYALTTG